MTSHLTRIVGFARNSDTPESLVSTLAAAVDRRTPSCAGMCFTPLIRSPAAAASSNHDPGFVRDHVLSVGLARVADLSEMGSRFGGATASLLTSGGLPESGSSASA